MGEDLGIGAQDRARQVVLTARPVAGPEDEQPRLPERRLLARPRPRRLRLCRRGGAGGLEKASGIVLELAGERLLQVERLDGRRQPRLRAVEPGGEAERRLRRRRRGG